MYVRVCTCMYQSMRKTNGRQGCAFLDDQGPFFLSWHFLPVISGSGYMSAGNRTHIVIYRLKVNRLSKNLFQRGVTTRLITHSII